MGELKFALADKAQKEKIVWQAREWIMFCAKTIDAQMPGFWSDIFSSAQHLFDSHVSTSDDPIIQEKVTLQKLLPVGFIATKSTVPAVTVMVGPNFTEDEIEYRIIRTPHRKETPIENSGRLRIVLDDAGELCAKREEHLYGTPQQVAEFLLDPLLRVLPQRH